MTDSDDAALVSGIIALARNLKLAVVAEGVESKMQLQLSKNQGCQMAQGYQISSPLPADRFEGLFKNA